MPFKQLPYHRPKHYLFSSQKSGRTWVRMILAKVLEEIGLNPAKIEMIPSFHTPFKQALKEKKLHKLNVIFLYRDPRDCVVSRYFEISRRRIRPKTDNPKKAYNSTLEDYIRRNDEYGIDAIVDYMNAWHRERGRFRSFMTVSYEDLHSSTVENVKNILRFIQMDCSENIVQKAVDYAEFENMKKIEATGKGNLIQNYHGTFGSRHTADPESFRVRKGKIGGFAEYLSPADIEYVNDRIKRLEEFFPYD